MKEELCRLEDSGTLLADLEASGFNRRTAAREEALDSLLSEYGVKLDSDGGEFFIGDLNEQSVPSAAMRLVAFLMRARDLLLLAETRVSTTFREDVARMLAAEINTNALIEEKKPLFPNIAQFVPDFVIRAPSRYPVGVFLGTSDARVLEAVIVLMRAKHEYHVPCVIVAVIEREKNISSAVRQEASNILDAVTYFRGRESEAIKRVVNEAIGEASAIH